MVTKSRNTLQKSAENLTKVCIQFLKDTKKNSKATAEEKADAAYLLTQFTK